MPIRDPRLRDLQIEYARILAEYRELATEPFSFIGFSRMQELVTRLEQIAQTLNTSADNLDTGS